MTTLADRLLYLSTVVTLSLLPSPLRPPPPPRGLLAKVGVSVKRYSPPQDKGAESGAASAASEASANGRGFNSVYSGMFVTCIFAEAIALYGMIAAVIVAGKGGGGGVGG